MCRVLAIASAVAVSAIILWQPALAQPASQLTRDPVVPAPDPQGTSPELARLNALILRSPNNTALNLRYARLAEKLNFVRKALVAYERILVYDPDNVEAQEGLDRIRRKLQPNQTQFVVEIGAAFESNPRYSPTLLQREGQLLAAGAVKDERTVGEIRWRTLGTGLLQLHGQTRDLNYGSAGAMTGPVLQLMPGLQVHTALGGSVAAFDQRFYYSEGMASATFEAYPSGAYRAVQVRAAYRDYNDFFPSSQGWYADATGRFLFPGILGEGTVLSLLPWVRWSDIRGGLPATLTPVVTPLLTTVQPGAYTELGGRVEYFQQVFEWLVVGPTFSVLGRFYRQDFDTTGTEHRKDTIVSPGAMVVFPNLLGQQKDLRLEYRYLWGHSNNALASFVDHVASVMMVSRF